jgi:hypothetical protein
VDVDEKKCKLSKSVIDFDGKKASSRDLWGAYEVSTRAITIVGLFRVPRFRLAVL